MANLIRYRRPLFQRVISACALVGFLLATIGVPVFEPISADGGKDRSQPFPCQHSSCGCKNAGMCWRSCCCHTNRSKLAWAKKHGVKPPKFVEVAAAKEEQSLAAVQGGCCSSAAAQSSPTQSCCSTSPASTTPQPAKESADETGLGESAVDGSWQLGFVPSIAARQCRGLDQLWLIFSSAAPPPAMVAWSIDETEAPLPAPLREPLVSLVLAPDTPPPKV
jgi:hypothetical protein